MPNTDPYLQTNSDKVRLRKLFSEQEYKGFSTIAFPFFMKIKGSKGSSCRGSVQRRLLYSWLTVYFVN